MARPEGTYKLTPEELLQAWNQYVQKCDSALTYQVSAGQRISLPKPRVYTIEAFCVFADIDTDTLNEYGKLADYSATVKSIRNAIFARKQDALVNAEGSTVGLIFDMKANYGINDKNLIEHSGEVSNKIIIVDAADCDPISENGNESDAGLPGE
jgi:hypothetical protein